MRNLIQKSLAVAIIAAAALTGANASPLISFQGQATGDVQVAQSSTSSYVVDAPGHNGERGFLRLQFPTTIEIECLPTGIPCRGVGPLGMGVMRGINYGVWTSSRGLFGQSQGDFLVFDGQWWPLGSGIHMRSPLTDSFFAFGFDVVFGQAFDLNVSFDMRLFNNVSNQIVVYEVQVDQPHALFAISYTAADARLSQFTFQRVPEPASLALLGIGLAGLAGVRRRSK